MFTVGDNADVYSVGGYSVLNRPEHEVGLIGYGVARMKDFGETAGKRTIAISYINDLFSNVTTDKVLVIALGTNDFAIDSTAAATFKTWYGDLLDDINTADSSITIYCISPLIRADDAPLLDDYRTAIDDLCTARAYATHIPGKNILSVGAPDFNDGVHPSNSGHIKYNNAIDPIINP